MSREELERRVAEFDAVQPWNHNFRLAHGVETRPGAQVSHGKNEVKWQRVKPLLDVIGVRGKRILDVGCNEGFFSLQLADLGGDVLGIDIDPRRIAKADFIRLATAQTGVRFGVVDIYSDEFARQPTFDLCLCMGVLHRVPDPFSLVARLVEQSGLILFEWKALKFGPHDEPFAYFSETGVDQKDYYGTEYWLPSFAAVENMLRRLGVTRFHRVDDPSQRRAILVAGRVDNSIFHRPDVRLPGRRLRAAASQTKRYVRTLLGIATGRING
jgi:tRNA (mo5U34)-methyltransferase